MKKIEQVLENSLLSQVSLEERLYKEVEQQLSQSNIDEYPVVKEMLSNVKKVLETHYSRLNLALDQVTKGVSDMVMNGEKELPTNESGNLKLRNQRMRREQVSQMLQDDYLALNLAAMGNTLLHTTALAADSPEIADVALEHLANLTNFVVKMNELMPRVVVQELSSQFPEVKPTVGDLAVKNTQDAWRNSDDVVKKPDQT